MTLAGRRILLTRPRQRARQLAATLGALGARVSARPTIQLLPPADPGPAREAVARLERYDWLVFTSPSGVEFFFERLARRHGPQPALTPRVAAIGRATAGRLRRLGHTVAVVARDSRSEGVARELSARLTAGERVLLIRPEVSRDVLEPLLVAAGAVVDAVAFYRNAPAPGIDAVVREIRDARFDVVVFTSPSTLERLLEAPGAGELAVALARCRLVAIGPVTARACERAGLRVDAVAREPSEAGIVEAIRSLAL